MPYLRPEDTLHKSYLNRLLIEIIDNILLSSSLAFKGGSCAEMLGFLDRFSVDLDFDVVTTAEASKLRGEFRKIFSHLGLTIIKASDVALFFQLKYAGKSGKRSTLRVSASSIKIQANDYRVQYLPEVDRLARCQTIETMFANKLVAITDRYKLHKSIAGRDIYDTHHFFLQGYAYKKEIIQERTGQEARAYLKKLIGFIKKYVTQTIVNEDLNSLLPADKFRQIRKVLIPETLSFLTREISEGVDTQAKNLR